MNDPDEIQSLPAPPADVLARVAGNLCAIKERMEEAAVRSDRPADDVQLVAVTKYASDEEVAALYHNGERLFGESRVQDAVPRIEQYPADCEWHMIGHLQRNKAKQAVGPFGLIHSVDSANLIQKLADEVTKQEIDFPVAILIQVNVSGEESKFGCDPADLQKLLELVVENGDDKLKVTGLMTMGPKGDSAEGVRPYFRKLRKMRDEMREAGFDLPELSMGMSGDFEVAIEEGATLVRIGSALFR